MVYPDKGYIGCFDMAERESGKRQLEGYVAQLNDAGSKRIIAPIDGSTWHSYRLVSWTDGTPPFPMEPSNPLWYNDVYADAGFKPLKKYRSDIFEVKDIPTSKGSSSIRGFRDGDLTLIYEMSVKGFKDNFLYDDISYADFSQLYSPFLPIIDRDLVVIAEAGGVPAGFIFSFAVGNILILKTMAVLSDYRSRGIGAQLISCVIDAARGKGCTTVIAALMSDDSNSRKIVAKYESRKIREYTLYCLES